MIQDPIPAAKATRERLSTDVSLNANTTGWQLLTESHNNREEYKATGELMLDINEDIEMWLTESSEDQVRPTYSDAIARIDEE